MKIQWTPRVNRAVVILPLAAAALSQSASAGLVAVSSQAVWNYYLGTAGLVVETETFNAIPDGFYSSPFGGSTASVAWSASASGGLYVSNGIFSTNNPVTLQFTFSPGVRAVAGNFFGTDINFNNISVLYTAKLSDGSGYSGIADNPSSFTGFFAQTASIAALTLTVTNIAGSTDVYPSVDNLYFGVPVPAPGAVSLLAVAGLVAARRRR